MKTFKDGDFFVSHMGSVVTVVHGETAMSFPSRDLSKLQRALQGVKFMAEKPDPFELPVSQAAPTVQQVDDTSTKKPRAKRGVLWKGVKAHLQASDRAQSFDSILKAVGHLRVEGKDLQHQLSVLLGRREGAGEIKRTATGRFRLANK